MLVTKRDELVKSLDSLVARLQAGEDVAEEVKAKTAEVNAISAQIKAANEAKALVDSMGAKTVAPAEAENNIQTSIGHQVAKSLEGLTEQDVRVRGFERKVAVKAAADTHVTPTGEHLLVPPQVHGIVAAPMQRLTVADWLGAGSTDSPLVAYYEEVPDAVEGDYLAVAENTKKPQLHVKHYKLHTEALATIAGYWKFSTQMVEDAEFLVTSINNILLRRLQLAEEKQLLSGDGTAPNLQGLLNRPGLLAETATSIEAAVDVILDAESKIETATGFTPDGILINPADYAALRKLKDGNGQYFAGGPFTGAYGNGGFVAKPGPWGHEAIVTPAIPKGTMLIGAGKSAAMVYRKGGVSVTTVYTNEDDFIHNRLTTRAEERLLLAVTHPSAFCKVTITG